MKRLILLAIVTVAVWAAPSVRRTALASLENTFDSTLRTSGMEVVALPRGVYLEGYGAVFTADVNLTYTPSINPFRLTISKEEVDKIYRIKLKQVVVLKAKMQTILVDAGSTLGTVPPQEQIVLVVTLGNEAWETTTGLPSQIYMQAKRSNLIAAKAGKIDPKTILKVQEL